MRGMPRDRHPSLPPGVTPSMIPGNRPEDVAFDRMVEDLMDVLEEEHGTMEQAHIYLWEEWSIMHKPDDGALDGWEDLAVWLCNEHEDTVQSILGWDEEPDYDYDERDRRRDNELMEQGA